MRNENMKKKHLDNLFEIRDSPQVKETTENHPSLASDFHKKRRNEETANCWGPALVTAHGASLPLRCWPSPRLVNVQWQVEDSKYSRGIQPLYTCFDCWNLSFLFYSKTFLFHSFSLASLLICFVKGIGNLGLSEGSGAVSAAEFGIQAPFFKFLSMTLFFQFQI